MIVEILSAAAKLKRLAVGERHRRSFKVIGNGVIPISGLQ